MHRECNFWYNYDASFTETTARLLIALSSLTQVSGTSCGDLIFTQVYVQCWYTNKEKM